jgi:hypothetical protein
MIQAVKQDTQIREEVEEIIKSGEIFEKDSRKFKKYSVKQGDTLWNISKAQFQSGIYWKKIAEDNGIKEPFFVRPGMELLIGQDIDHVAAGKGEKPFEYRVVSNRAFGVGEKLTFSVKYFGIVAGFATLEVRDIETINGRKTYLIAATAKTAPFFEGMYRVRDLITSNMDILGMFSWKYSKKLEEGKYRNDSYMEFDHKAGLAKKKDGKECAVPAFVQDVLSEFYYYRVLFTGKEKELFIDTASDECKSERVAIQTIGEERIKVDAGEFDTWHVRPFLKYEGVFRQKGDVDIWLTKDENKVPVMVKSRILIGTIDVELQEAVVVKAE